MISLPSSSFISSPILSFFPPFLKSFFKRMGWGAGGKWELFEDLGNRKPGTCSQTSLNNVSQSGIWGHPHQRNLSGSCQVQGSTAHGKPVQSVAPGVCMHQTQLRACKQSSPFPLLTTSVLFRGPLPLDKTWGQILIGLSRSGSFLSPH